MLLLEFPSLEIPSRFLHFESKLDMIRSIRILNLKIQRYKPRQVETVLPCPSYVASPLDWTLPYSVGLSVEGAFRQVGADVNLLEI